MTVIFLLETYATTAHVILKIRLFSNHNFWTFHYCQHPQFWNSTEKLIPIGQKFTYLLKSSLDQRWKQCYCRWSHWGWPRGASGRGQGGRSGKNVYRHNGGRFGHWATLWQTWSNDWCRHTSGCHHWFNQALWPEFSKFCSKIIDWTSANIWSSYIGVCYIYQKTCKLLLLE